MSTQEMTKRLLLVVLLASFAHGQLPDGPKPHDPLFNKKFIFVHAALAGSVVYDVEMGQAGQARHKCAEANSDSLYPSRGHMYAQQFAVAGIVTGFDLLMRRARVPVAPYIGGLLGSVIHIQAGSQWVAHGCF